MRDGFPTGTRSYSSFEEAHSLLGGRVCVSDVRYERFCKNSDYPLKHILGFILCKL
jgi:hypothetical protein